MSTAEKEEGLYGLRNTLLNDALFWSALAAVPAVLLSVARVSYLGWQPAMFFHMFCLAGLWMLWLGRHAFTFRNRVVGLLGVMWVATYVDLAQFGPAGAGSIFFVLSSFVAILFLPVRLAWRLIVGNVAVLALFSLAASAHWLVFTEIDYPRYAHNPVTWLLEFWVLASFGSILALVGRRMLQEQVDRDVEAKELDARMRKVATNVPGVIYQFLMRPDGEMRFLYLSDGVERILGIKADVLLNDPGCGFGMIHPEDMKGVMDSIRTSARNLSHSQQTFRMLHPAKGVIWIERNSTPERLANGDILWHGFMSDITPIKAAEGHLAATLENAPSLAAQWYDREGRVLYWNRTSETLYGWSKAEAEGKTIDELIATPEQAEEFRSTLQRIEQTGEVVGPAEWHLRHRDGSLRIVSSTSFQLEGSASPVFVCMDFDVTAQKRIEADLVKAKELAESANRAKSAFLAAMSHELRTPLNAISGFAQLLQIGLSEPLSPAQQEAVGHILGSSQHLLELINEVLDLARIEAGHIHISVESLQVQPLIEEVIALSRPEAKARDIALQQACAGEVRAVGDASRTRQILLNLVSNAIKYNRHGGSVTVICSEVDGHVRVTVVDSGRGIREEQRGLVFQPFQRLGVEEGAVEGTGIGLVVCKRLVEAMRGRIGFESTFGVGSRFWFELPMERRAKARGVIGPDPVQQTEPLPSSSVQGRVLYIEDNPVNTKVMQHIFRLLPGVELLTAESAEDGLSMAARRPPDLVLMDVGLPGMSGYEALAEMKTNPETAHIPVMAVTASAMAQDIAQGLEAGFLAYLTKPIDVPSFLDKVRSLLAK